MKEETRKPLEESVETVEAIEVSRTVEGRGECPNCGAVPAGEY